jgi:hypothetical protein
LREHLGDEADALAQGRFQILNVWRPLVDPVEDYPLALCDARSLTPADLVDTERRAPNHRGDDHPGQRRVWGGGHSDAGSHRFEAIMALISPSKT